MEKQEKKVIFLFLFFFSLCLCLPRSCVTEVEGGRVKSDKGGGVERSKWLS